MMGVFVGILTIIGVIVLAVVLVLVRLLTRKQDSEPSRDEAMMVQDMFRTLDRLEKRVDVLETLLADSRKPSGRQPEDI